MSFDTIFWAKKRTVGSPGRKAVLMSLAEYADEDHSTGVAIKTVARETEQSVRSVQRALRELEAMELVRRSACYGDGGARVEDRFVLCAPVTDSQGEVTNRQGGGDTTGTLSPGVATVTPISREKELSLGAIAPVDDPNTTIPPVIAKIAGDNYPEQFQKTWVQYPKQRRTAKGDTYKFWRATVVREVEAGRSAREVMLDLYHAAVNYRRDCEARVATGELEWRYAKTSGPFFGRSEFWKDWVSNAGTAYEKKAWEA